MTTVGHAGAAVRAYVRDVLTLLCPSLLPAWRVLRWRGAYMCVCAWGFRTVLFPVELEEFGALTNRGEFLNFIGNVCVGELRNATAETLIASADAPLVVDVGVNIGVTVRWWLSLSPRARVIGLDMMQEAVDYTTSKVASIHAADRWVGIVGVVGAAAQERVLRFDDPLDGTTSLTRSDGARTRTVAVKTLDDWLAAQPIADMVLLKVDVEGAAADVLAGAERILARTTMVVFEGHDELEIRESSSLLFARGFRLTAVHGRNFWWIREAHGAPIQ